MVGVRHPLRICAAVLAVGVEAGAVPLLDGFGGPDGYGTPDHCVAVGNDNSYAARGSSEPTAIDLDAAFPGGFWFYGRRVRSFFLNTNGTVTFAAPLASPVPVAFPVEGQPMIAPWWGDVDTRVGGSVCFHLQPYRLVATWHDVGAFGSRSDARNDFQMVLSTRPLCDHPGSFDVEFRYRRCEWVSGAGDPTPAQVGLDEGSRINYLTLPTSRTPAIAEVCRTSNVPGGEPGLYRFQVRTSGGVIGCNGAGQPCEVEGARGRCAASVRQCGGSAGESVCVSLRAPRARACDGLDNDCDGTVDDADALCAAGEVCDRARCLPRADAAGRCPEGTSRTERGGCIDEACGRVVCSPGERCAGGRCAGLCEGVTCAPGERCDDGRCRDRCDGARCDGLTVCDHDPGSETNGQCVVRCECGTCREGTVCGPDGWCVPPPAVDGGVAADAGAAVDVGAVVGDGGEATRVDGGAIDPGATVGRLQTSGCGCRARGGTTGARGAVAWAVLAAGIGGRRSRSTARKRRDAMRGRRRR